MKAVSEGRILNSLDNAIVHKSIEKTQKFNYFWVFCGLVCSKKKFFWASAPEGS
jgi:hypothetical protein